MLHRYLAAALLILLGSSSVQAKKSVHDQWETAREKVFTFEGATAIMDKAREYVAPDGYMVAYTFCDDKPCITNQAETAVNLPFAYRGVYTAQRNIAFCLDTGCDGSNYPQTELSCAWRIVIAVSGDPEVDASDADNLAYCLKKLEPANISIARAHAARIFRQIYKKQIPADWR